MKSNPHPLTEEDLVPAAESEMSRPRESAAGERQKAGIPPDPTASRERRLSGTIMIGVPFLLVLVTFLFWYQTWFGRRMAEAELREYLVDTSVPHKTQHALTQVVTEIVRHDPQVKRVYPKVVALAGSKEPGIRSMAAWAMGQDASSPEFHQALLNLVADPQPLVRGNAALGLARFGDATGEPELKAMLHAHDEQQIWEALVALYLVGKPDALADVEPLARPGNGASERVREQAALTAAAIRKRM